VRSLLKTSIKVGVGFLPGAQHPLNHTRLRNELAKRIIRTPGTPNEHLTKANRRENFERYATWPLGRGAAAFLYKRASYCVSLANIRELCASAA
jgi:hypothetical protein